MEINEITEKVIGAAIKIHRELGPGLLESAYQACLHYELLKLGLKVKREYPLPLIYDGVDMDIGYRLDLWVEDKLVIELKSVQALNPIHMAQTLTYLKLANCQIGLLINFNVLQLTQGVRRLLNKYFIAT